MKPRTRPTAVKVSQSVVAGMLARMFGVPKSDDIMDVLGEISLDSNFPFMRHVKGMLSWSLPIPSEVMLDTPGPLVEQLLSYEGEVMLVKDSQIGREGSLWIVALNPDREFLASISGKVFKGLFNLFPAEDGGYRLVAYQLVSCLRKK